MRRERNADRMPALLQPVQLLKIGTDRISSTYVADVDGDRLAVAAPQDGIFRPGERVALQYLRPESVYRLETVIQARTPGAPDLLWLEPPASLQRVQRRRGVRIDVMLPATLTPVDQDGRVANGEGVTYRTVDVSAYGCKLARADDLPPPAWETTYRVDLQLADGPVTAKARVVRAEQGHYALEFTEIAENARERIIRMIFAEERRRRSMGLI